MLHSLARAALAACSLIVFAATSAAPQDAAAPQSICRTGTCAIIFDWGNGATAVSFGTDRRYGAPADFEAGIRQLLTERGFRLSDRTEGADLTISMRLSMMSAICDFLPGTNTDRTCRTVRDAALTFTNADAKAKALGSQRLVNRCGSGDQVMTNAQFAKYAADVVQYAIEGEQAHMGRPSSRC
jgi:hypothetical protein